jgi:signal transduction histidine kinase
VTVNAGELLTSVCRTFVPLCAAKRQTLALELAPNLPTVFADPDRLTQVMTNLVSNAVKYTPDGGRITARTASDGQFVTLSVTDTGIGMSQEEQARLFSSFYRVKNEQTRAIPGTGLGLTITRMLVDMHGGHIDVTSAPGEGSTFAVVLPLGVPA